MPKVFGITIFITGGVVPLKNPPSAGVEISEAGPVGVNQGCDPLRARMKPVSGKKFTSVAAAVGGISTSVTSVLHPPTGATQSIGLATCVCGLPNPVGREPAATRPAWRRMVIYATIPFARYA